MAQELKTKSTSRNWLLLMHFDVSLMYSGVLLMHFGCVLITSGYLLMTTDYN